MSDRQIHITRKGEQHGPYPEASAREMLAAGQLLPTDLAWHAGADGWKPLSEVLGASQPPATPAAGPPASPQGGGLPKRQMAGAAPEEEKPADDEPGDPDKICVTRKGEAIGPYSRDKAKEYFAAGQLLPTDWGWHDGMDEWKPLYEVLGMEVPTQASFAPATAAGKPGKGKKVAIIIGIVVLVAGLAAAGYFFLYPMLKGDGEGSGKVVGFWDKVDPPEFEKKDNNGAGDYEFFANGEAAMDPGTMIESRGTWELKNQEIVFTWTEPIPLTRYFKIDNDGFLRLIGQEMGGKTTRVLSPDKWKKATEGSGGGALGSDVGESSDLIAKTSLGLILLGIGFLMSLAGSIWFLVVAFQESIAWGIGCLLCGFVGIAFLFMRWDVAKKPFLVSLGGGVFYYLAMRVAGG